MKHPLNPQFPIAYFAQRRKTYQTCTLNKMAFEPFYFQQQGGESPLVISRVLFFAIIDIQGFSFGVINRTKQYKQYNYKIETAFKMGKGQNKQDHRQQLLYHQSVHDIAKRRKATQFYIL